MNGIWKRFSLAAIALLAAACTTLGAIEQGRSTRAEVRSRMGIPTDIRFQPDGREVWEYAKGPSGRQTYMVTFDKNGIATTARQVLTDETVAQIVRGTSTKRDVRALLGKPADVEFFASGEVWDYNMEEVPKRPYILVVRFRADGVVEDVGRVMETTGDDLFNLFMRAR